MAGSEPGASAGWKSAAKIAGEIALPPQPEGDDEKKAHKELLKDPEHKRMCSLLTRPVIAGAPKDEAAALGVLNSAKRALRVH